MNDTLRPHASRLAAASIAELFAREPDRLSRLSLDLPGFYADFSKHRIDAPALTALADFAARQGFVQKRSDLFAGAKVNVTEDRPALHMALRAPELCPDPYAAMVREARHRARLFAESIRSGAQRAADGGPFTHILHLGIGGSDLGPRLLADAFWEHASPDLGLRFCANAEAGDFERAIDGLDPRRTLVFFVSKSFSTAETQLNAQSAKAWITDGCGPEAVESHFALASANVAAAEAWGVARDRIFPFWAWVGGRYSVWSAGSLSIEIAYGSEMFEQMLEGGAALDRHFLEAPILANGPALAALVEYWNAFLLKSPTRCVAAYCKGLERLPFYLQQLEMESLGKHADLAGAAALPAPIVWGGEGTLIQHSFFQRLHQANDVTPLDFIAVAANRHGREAHDRLTLAHALAQAEAFMLGRSAHEAIEQLTAAGLASAEAARLAPHLICPGGRGSSFYLFERLTPAALGAFLAFQEHKTFALSVLMNVNAFDQFGVELGKQLSLRAGASLAGVHEGRHDPSTIALIERIKRIRKI